MQRAVRLRGLRRWAAPPRPRTEAGMAFQGQQLSHAWFQFLFQATSDFLPAPAVQLCFFCFANQRLVYFVVVLILNVIAFPALAPPPPGVTAAVPT